MSDKRVFVLAHQEARRRALEAVAAAPDGYAVTVREPLRTLDQNALLWPLLECFSKQLQWPVNGAMVTLEPEEWKDILSAAFSNETARIAMGLNGGMVILGLRTSTMGKHQFSQFIEFILATAADRDVSVERPDMREMPGRAAGGRARAAALTPERRKEIAQKGAKARWQHEGEPA